MTGTTTRILTFGLALTTLGGLTGCDETGETIGPEGGFVTSEDGRLTLEVPAGALDEATRVSIEVTDEGPDGAIRTYAIEPMFTPLARPATVEYDWSVTDGASGLELANADASQTRLVIERDTVWTPLADFEVDVDGEYAAGSAVYFGVIAVVVRAD